MGEINSQLDSSTCVSACQIQEVVVWWRGGIPLGQCSRITHTGLAKAVSAREACLLRRGLANAIWDDNVQVFYASSLWLVCGAEMIFQSGLWKAPFHLTPPGLKSRVT